MKIITCITLFFCLQHTLLYTAAQQVDPAPSTVITPRSSLNANIPPQLHPQPQPQPQARRHTQSCWQRAKRPLILVSLCLLGGTFGGLLGKSVACNRELKKFSTVCATPHTNMTDSCWGLLAFECSGHIKRSGILCPPANTTVTADDLIKSTRAQWFNRQHPTAQVCVEARGCGHITCPK